MQCWRRPQWETRGRRSVSATRGTGGSWESGGAGGQSETRDKGWTSEAAGSVAGKQCTKKGSQPVVAPPSRPHRFRCLSAIRSVRGAMSMDPSRTALRCSYAQCARTSVDHQSAQRSFRRIKCASDLPELLLFFRRGSLAVVRSTGGIFEHQAKSAPNRRVDWPRREPSTSVCSCVGAAAPSRGPDRTHRRRRQRSNGSGGSSWCRPGGRVTARLQCGHQGDGC